MKLNIKHLDFDGFHPLDHSLWECRGYPGGWRTHIKYEWDFRKGPAFRARTRCKLGRHSYWSVWYRGGAGYVGGVHCPDCRKEASPAARKDALIRDRNQGFIEPDDPVEV